MKLNHQLAIDYIKQHPKLVIAEDYELVSHQVEERGIHYSNGQIFRESKDSFWWLQLRVLHRKKVGIASTVFSEEKDLDALVERTFELAEQNGVDPWFRFPLWKPLTVFKKNNEMVSQKITDSEKDFFSPLFPLLSVQPYGLDERYTERRELRTISRKTEKAILSSDRKIQKLSLSLLNEGRSGLYKIEETRGTTHPFKDKGMFLDSLMRKAIRLSSGRKASQFSVEAFVLSGEIVASLLKSIEPLFYGNLAGEGKSCFSKDLGKVIFSEKVSLIDDGLWEGGEGSQAFDFEGVLSQQTRIVDAGVLKTFLHDAASSSRYNRASTSNLNLNDSLGPTLGVTNLYLEPSGMDTLKLFSEMHDGIYFECLERVGSELTRDGKLELLGHGWRIQNGEPVEPLCHVFVTVDPIEILRKISLVSSDLEFWGRYGSPSVLIQKMPLVEI
jgi:predicted Zn-dependent protease